MTRHRKQIHSKHQHDSETMEWVGIMLEVERERAGLTQQELAAKTDGVSRQTISNIERGKCNATISTLSAVSKALGVAVADLVPHYDFALAARRELAAIPNLDEEIRRAKARNW